LTGNTLLDLAISVAGVALLVGLAWAIFRGGSLKFDRAAAADRLAFDEPDFAPVDWIIDENSRVALARNAAGELALVVAHGDGLVTRRLAPGDDRANYADGFLTIARVDHTSRAARLPLPENEAAVWLEKP